MNGNVKMSVSAVTRSGDKKAIYVLFQDGKQMAEFSLPDCNLVRNNGFDEEELKKLREYLDGERDMIYSMAKEINPIKAFMK